jgi:hypothetical protein
MQMDDAAPDVSALSRSDKRTLAALFRHPLAHNLPWSDVLALFGKVAPLNRRRMTISPFRPAARPM